MSEKKILMVDDEASIRRMYCQVFNRSGYVVRAVESAEEALGHLKEENFDVMFLDLNLPEMNGIELCRLIHKDRPMAIIFAVTGYASLFELAECREAGFDDYFIKPVDMKTLLGVVENAFEKVNRWRNN